MTTQYEISIVRYDDFGTDAADRVDMLQLATAEVALAALVLQQMSQRLTAKTDQPAPVTAGVEPGTGRRRRSDAGKPRGSAPIEMPIPVKQDAVALSPFSTVATANGGVS